MVHTIAWYAFSFFASYLISPSFMLNLSKRKYSENANLVFQIQSIVFEYNFCIKLKLAMHRKLHMLDHGSLSERMK